MTAATSMSARLAHLQLATARLDWLPPAGDGALASWTELALTHLAGEPGCTVSGDLRRVRWWLLGEPVTVSIFGGAFWRHAGAAGGADDLLRWAAAAQAPTAGVWVEVAPQGVDSGWWVDGSVPLREALDGEAAETPLLSWADASGVTAASSVGWSVRGLGEDLELTLDLPGDVAGQRLDALEDLFTLAPAAARPPVAALARLEAYDADDAIARVRLADDGVEEVSVTTRAAAHNELLVGLLDDLGLTTAEEHAWVQGVLQSEAPSAVNVGAELEVSYLLDVALHDG